jgi:gamma-glutamylcyclotransferase (GGCT)/AIG2-like uncharacterized protein YtfP
MTTTIDPPFDLAVYGTLRRGERNAPLLAGAAYLGEGLVAGRLIEMPSNADRAYAYPALVAAPGDVTVEIYRLADRATLARLDALEGFDPRDEAGSEYVRRSVEIRDGPVRRAWIYIYNGAPDGTGGTVIGGDWVRHRSRGTG